MSLAEYEGYCESSNIPTGSVQVEASDPRKEVLHQIQMRHIDIFFCARETLTYCTEDTNLIFSFFSSLKRLALGSVVNYVQKYNDHKRCKVVIL